MLDELNRVASLSWVVPEFASSVKRLLIASFYKVPPLIYNILQVVVYKAVDSTYRTQCLLSGFQTYPAGSPHEFVGFLQHQGISGYWSFIVVSHAGFIQSLSFFGFCGFSQSAFLETFRFSCSIWDIVCRPRRAGPVVPELDIAFGAQRASLY
jgi:hypothetical protein